MATKSLFYQQMLTVSTPKGGGVGLGSNLSYVSSVTVDPQNLGSGYAVNDVLVFAPVVSSQPVAWLWQCKIVVTAVNSAGGITGYQLQVQGNIVEQGAIATANKPASPNTQGSFPTAEFLSSGQGQGAYFTPTWVDGQMPQAVKYCQVQGEAADIRYRLDGVNPTETSGSLLKAEYGETWTGSGSSASTGGGGTPTAISQPLVVAGGQMAKALFIGPSGAILNVEYMTN